MCFKVGILSKAFSLTFIISPNQVVSIFETQHLELIRTRKYCGSASKHGPKSELSYFGT